jgi:hypothetical protein
MTRNLATASKKRQRRSRGNFEAHELGGSTFTEPIIRKARGRLAFDGHARCSDRPCGRDAPRVRKVCHANSIAAELINWYKRSGRSPSCDRSPQVADYRHGVAERLVGEFHEPGKSLIHIKNQKNCSGDRKGTYAQCRHRHEVPGRKKPEADE